MGFIVVPHHQLQAETLRSLIEEFVTRDGAVHGHEEPALSERIDAVHRQLKTGKVVIVFEEETESCTIIPREQLTKPRT